MPCSDQHATCPEPAERVPILDELQMLEDQKINNSSVSSVSSVAKKRRGGPRANSGPPKGNLNALKHGRFSRRHKIILEAILEVPKAREALIGIMKRNRTRQKQAELEAAYILMRWLATHNPHFLPNALDQVRPEWEAEAGGGHERAANIEAPSLSHSPAPSGAPPAQNNQTQNDQLETALADMREAFNKKLLRKTTRKRTPKPADQPNTAGPVSLTRREPSANLNPVPEQENPNG